MSDIPSNWRDPATVKNGIPIYSQAGDEEDLAEMQELVDMLRSNSGSPTDRIDPFRLPNRPNTFARRRGEERVLREFRRRFPRLGGMKILNISCGVGREAARLLEMGADDITLLDVSFPAVEYARDHLPLAYPDAELEFLVSTADVLPFEDRAFDLTVIYGSMHHYPDPGGFVAELTRVCDHAAILSEPAILGPAQGLLDLIGWNTEYGGVDSARLEQSAVRELFERRSWKVEVERFSHYYPKSLDSLGNSKRFVRGWYRGLRIADQLTPGFVHHAMNVFARRA